MKCHICHEWSWQIVCDTCKNEYLKPRVYRQNLTSNIEVISFYKYDEIAPLLKSKHTPAGHAIYKVLAKEALTPFADALNLKEPTAAVAIDENVGSGYSHTALLLKYMRSKNLTPHHNCLRAKNPTSYSNKTLAYRKNNPRNFNFKNFNENSVIILDDIITTGTTLREAVKILKKRKMVLFCVTLAYVSRN